MIDELTTVIAIDSLGQVRNIAMSFFKTSNNMGAGIVSTSVKLDSSSQTEENLDHFTYHHRKTSTS